MLEFMLAVTRDQHGKDWQTEEFWASNGRGEDNVHYVSGGVKIEFIMCETSWGENGA